MISSRRRSAVRPAVFRFPEGTETTAFPFPGSLTSRPAISADGKALAAVVDDQRVVVWRRSGRDWVRSEQRLESAATAAALDAGGKLLLLGAEKGTAYLRDANSGQRREPSFLHPGSIRCAAFRADAAAVLLGGDDAGDGGVARAWSLDKPKTPLGPPLPHPVPILGYMI